MDCSKNIFCSQLSKATRNKLCKHCRRKFFKAQSIQLREDAIKDCMMVLYGTLSTPLNLGYDILNHEREIPAIYLAMPGRLLNLNITFDSEELEQRFRYAEYEYLTDAWVASFSHHVIRDLSRADENFNKTLLKNMVLLTTDICQLAAFFRSGYTYYGVYHLIRELNKYDLFLTQQQLADLMNRDRTTISKVIHRIKKEDPTLWNDYLQNKGRILSRPNPPSD